MPAWDRRAGTAPLPQLRHTRPPAVCRHSVPVPAHLHQLPTLLPSASSARSEGQQSPPHLPLKSWSATGREPLCGGHSPKPDPEIRTICIE